MGMQRASFPILPDLIFAVGGSVRNNDFVLCQTSKIKEARS